MLALLVLLVLSAAPAQPPAAPDSAAAAPDTAAPAPDTAARAATAPALPARDYLAEVRADFTSEDGDYWGIKTALNVISPLAAILFGLLILFSGLSARLRDLAFAAGRSGYVRVLVTFALYLGVMALLFLPLAWYDTFAVEHQFGLSNQSWGDWVVEQLKSLGVILFFLGVVPLLWLAYKVLAASPRRWWLWLALAFLPLAVTATLLQPLVVDPLFNRFGPLENPRLEARILDLARRAGVPGGRVLQVDRSAQTRKYNAYVSGFGASHRIVLWDTLLEGMAEDEILFVMGHEIGHYALGHIWQGIAFAALLSLLVLGATAWLADRLMRRCGRWWGFHELSDPASLPLLAICLTAVLLLLQPAIVGFSRRLETEADLYALEITRDNDAGARAFLALGSQNRSNPEPPRWARFLLYTHPALGERVRLALTYRPWAEGRSPRFYRGS